MKPFDLEAAKAGAPLVTRDGRKARFIAHVPEFRKSCRVYAAIGENDTANTFYEDGRFMGDCEDRIDLFMYEEEKKPVVRWLWVDEHNRIMSVMQSEEEVRHGLTKLEFSRTEFAE